MRLQRLVVEQYGNFERLDLALAAEPGRINLVVAPNGAGKSVLRQAFHDLLFGYLPKSKMNFRYRTGLNLQAEAVTKSGENLHFGWRHPGGRAFPDSHDAAMATRFGAALGGIRPPQLEYLFALDTARLRAGGEELAQGGDSLGLALLSGTGELISAKTARAELAERRDGVWEAGKSSRPLARSAKALEDARKKARGGVQLPVQRAREVSALDAERARLKDARETHAAMQQKASRLARIDRTRRFLEEHRAASEWLADHPDAPVLAASLADDLAEARSKASLAAADLSHAQKDAVIAENAAAAFIIDTQALEHAEALASLAANIGSVEKASRDAVKVQAERRGHLALVAAALQDLGASVAVEQASTVLPRLADVTTARQLIAQHASHLDKLETADRNLREAQETLRQLETAALPPPRSVDSLQAMLLAIRADRDPTRHAAETAAAARQANAAAASALAAIPGWSGTVAALQAQPIPLEASFVRLDQARLDAAAALREREVEHERLAKERETWSRDLQALQGRPLPDDGAIAQARLERDAGWRLIYRRAFTAQPPDPAEERAYAGEEPLALVFERRLRAADDLADQRLAELQRVEEAGRLTRALERSAPEWEQLTAACESAGRALRSSQQAFGAACRELGLDQAASLADVRQALARRAEALAAAIQSDQARAEHEAVLAQHAAWAAQLQRLLAADADQPFAALLAAADALLQTEALAKEARIEHETNRRNVAARLARAESDRAEAEAVLGEWQQRWADCLTMLGRPADEMPAVTEAVLQCLAGLAAADSDATALAKRIADMNDDVAGFGQNVAALASQLGMPPEADSFALARRLIARHDTAQTQRTRSQDANDVLRDRRAALAKAAEAERAAGQTLNAIIAACGAADGDQAESRLAASRERASQERLRDNAAAGLREHGEGLALAALQADAESVTADQAASEREQTQHALAAARDASEAAASRVRELEQKLDEAAAATDLNESVFNQEGAAATFGHLLDDYLVLSVAEQMLAQSIAEVEARAGSNGVSRIAAAFASVTNGDYTIEGADGEGGKTILIAVERRWPNEKKPLAQLSEGTRDQLYLALRIVAIEDHAAAAPPLPFVADDILQTFDDTRALAALQALLALSRHTQVIVLTHHPHLAALAAELPQGSVHLARI